MWCVCVCVCVYVVCVCVCVCVFFLNQSTQLWWGPGIFWVANSLVIACQSAKGPGGTSSAKAESLGQSSCEFLARLQCLLSAQAS